MKKFKVLMVAILVFGLVGCSSSKAINEQNEKLDKILEAVTKEDENVGLPGVYTFKDFVEMEVKVLSKIEGSELYPYLLMVTDEDVDHNTPLIIAVESKELYDTINVDEDYKMKVYVINVVEENNTKTRFSFMLDKVLK